MKEAIRRMVTQIVEWTNKHCCPTYGDVAELSPGPCRRCVGHEVRGGGVTECTPNAGAVGRRGSDVPTSGLLADESKGETR